ncbi:hypothetical protein DCAR_0313162 [Daucus carota subsp. sativus]|uniref:Uncharacterized protein n=1 Tax=Daucus carota subsp. sativus TaxID=79200 RepID=A0AAF0WQF8_DAUCS|nr:hypothetical protein DCAR_0313162 [Daucus carota subsp. sativus]
MTASQQVIAIFLVTYVVAVSSGPSIVTYIFGDSLTEVGNNNYLQLSLAKSNFPYYGIDYKGGMATGRFTNGRTIGDIISEKLGIPSPPPFLSLSLNDDAILKGVNYASGGAGILNDTGIYFISSFNLLCFSYSYCLITVTGNKSCGLFSGSNDYVNNYLQPFLADGQQYTHDEFIGLLISTLGEQLTRLHQLGARKMVFHGLGPLGCIPSQRVKSKRGQCLKQVNEWVIQFNSRVQKLLDALNRNLYGAKLAFADTYSAVWDLIHNPTAYGFKISNTSCCNVDTSVGGLCLPNSKLCKNRTEYVFWDAFHPSDAANVVLANKFFSILFPEPHPPSPTPLPHY